MEKNILIIDDNPDDLEFYGGLLSQSEANYTVLFAPDGEAAIDIAKELDIYCVFIDYYLPEMNGIKILNALQSLRPDKTLPTVILTGEPTQKVQAEAARQGALDYIVKDLTNSTQQLDAVIEKVVSWSNTL